MTRLTLSALAFFVLSYAPMAAERITVDQCGPRVGVVYVERARLDCSGRICCYRTATGRHCGVRADRRVRL